MGKPFSIWDWCKLWRFFLDTGSFSNNMPWKPLQRFIFQWFVLFAFLSFFFFNVVHCPDTYAVGWPSKSNAYMHRLSWHQHSIFKHQVFAGPFSHSSFFCVCVVFEGMFYCNYILAHCSGMESTVVNEETINWISTSSKWCWYITETRIYNLYRYCLCMWKRGTCEIPMLRRHGFCKAFHFQSFCLL